MKRYDSYKDSGVEWLGEIPSHWELKRWRLLLIENHDSNINLETRNQLQFKYGEIVPKSTQSDDEESIKTIQKYTVVKPGDIMINGLNLNYDFISQRVAKVGEIGAITSAYVSLRPTPIANPSFYNYLLKSLDAKKMFHGMGTGVRLTLSYKELKSRFLPYPSPAEQESIVEYLDKETAKIDEAIAQQQRMIDLLNERKQIIITHAVTRGLNPDVPLRDSGIDWLGDIPSHWKVIPIKRAARIILGKMLDSKGVGQNKLYKYFCAKDVHFDGVSFDDLKEMYFTNEEKDTYRVYNGDLLLVEGGAGAGGASIVRDMDFDAYVQNSIMILRAKENMINRYLFYILQSLVKRGYIEYACNKATIPHFTKEKTGATLIPLPLPEEQQEIVHYIDSQVVKIDEAIEKQKRFIELLQERKQIIINEVVTGKVKIS